MPGLRGHVSARTTLALLARAVELSLRVPSGSDVVLLCVFTTRKQGDVEISTLPISLRDGLVIDFSFVCEFKGSSRAPGGWNNGVRHSNDVLQARANVKNNKYKDVYGIVHKAFAPVM